MSSLVRNTLCSGHTLLLGELSTVNMRTLEEGKRSFGSDFSKTSLYEPFAFVEFNI